MDVLPSKKKFSMHFQGLILPNKIFSSSVDDNFTPSSVVWFAYEFIYHAHYYRHSNAKLVTKEHKRETQSWSLCEFWF